MVKRDAEYFDGGLLLDRSSIEDNGGYWPVPTMVGNCKGLRFGWLELHFPIRAPTGYKVDSSLVL